MKRRAILLLIFVTSFNGGTRQFPSFAAAAATAIIPTAIIPTTAIVPTTTRPPVTIPTTLPIHLDHNRILFTAGVPLPGGKIKPINVWLDNGTPDMTISERLARELGLTTTHDSATDITSAAPPPTILIGDLPIDLSRLKQIEVERGTTVGSGLEADINLPSSVLCHYDVVIDYPGKLITLANPGSVHFSGKATAAYVNPENHLIQLPAKLGADSFNLALDAGTPVTFIAANLISKFSKDHPSWPSMYGAVGIANLWGLDDEPDWYLLKVSGLVYGNISFPEVIIVSFPTDRLDYFQKRAGLPTAGLMGAASLLNYRLGIDYAHGIVYFEQVTKPVDPDMDLIGITLRPEAGGGYSILGVARYQEQPAVTGISKGDMLLQIDGQSASGLTMGAIWSLLRGTPGKRKELTLQRAGKVLTVAAVTRCFLCK